MQLAAVVANDTIGNRQSQAGTAAFPTRGEKRIDDLFQGTLIDPFTLILDPENNLLRLGIAGRGNKDRPIPVRQAAARVFGTPIVFAKSSPDPRGRTATGILKSSSRRAR